MEPWAILITTIGGIVTAIVAGMVTIITGRKKAAAEAQTSLNAGFGDLVKVLREQVLFQSERINELGKEIVEYNDRLRYCEERVTQLSRFIRQNGHSIPKRPNDE